MLPVRGTMKRISTAFLILSLTLVSGCATDEQRPPNNNPPNNPDPNSETMEVNQAGVIDPITGCASGLEAGGPPAAGPDGMTRDRAGDTSNPMFASGSRISFPEEFPMSSDEFNESWYETWGNANPGAPAPTADQLQAINASWGQRAQKMLDGMSMQDAYWVEKTSWQPVERVKIEYDSARAELTALANGTKKIVADPYGYQVVNSTAGKTLQTGSLDDIYLFDFDKFELDQFGNTLPVTNVPSDVITRFVKTNEAFGDLSKYQVPGALDFRNDSSQQLSVLLWYLDGQLDRTGFSLGVSVDLEPYPLTAPERSYSPQRELVSGGIMTRWFGMRVNSMCQVEVRLNQVALPAPHLNHDVVLVSENLVTLGQYSDIYFSIETKPNPAGEKLASITISGANGSEAKTEVFVLPDDFQWFYQDLTASDIENIYGDSATPNAELDNIMEINGPLMGDDLDPMDRGLRGKLDWFYVANGTTNPEAFVRNVSELRGQEAEAGSSGIVLADVEISPDGYAASLQLSQEDYASFTTNADQGHEVFSVVAAAYQVLADDFEYVAIVPNTDIDITASKWGDLGRNYTVSGDETGTRADGPLVNGGGPWGSRGTLESVLLFPFRDSLESGPVLHEFAHRFGNNILIAQGIPGEPLAVDYGVDDILGHWGFSSVNGVLGGFDKKTLKSEGAGKYSVAAFGIIGNNRSTFSDFELYLAGLKKASEIEDLVLFKNVDYDSIKERNGRLYFSAGEKVTLTIEDIIAAVGPRSPMYLSAPNKSKLLTLVVTDRPLTSAEWAKYDRQSKNLEQLYSTGTKGLAQLTTGGLEKSRLPG